MQIQEKKRQLKFVFIGSPKTGKTSLIQKSTENTSNSSCFATLCADFKMKSLQLDNTHYNLQIWDSSGQEKFIHLLSLYLKNADCVFIVYNPSDRASFEKLTSWANLVRSNSHSNTKIVVVENLFGGCIRNVSKKESYEMIRTLELPLISVDVKIRSSIDSLFCNSINYVIGNEVTWTDMEERKNISSETDKNVNIATEKAPAASRLNQDYDHLFKMLIIGDSGTGKSSILLRFSDNLFNEAYLATIGVDFKIKTIEIDNMNVKLQIWDTAGQERFRTITAAYYKGTDCIFITYSSGDRESFENVILWLKEVERFTSNKVKVALVENEFENTERQVAEHEGQEFAKKYNMEFFRVNAKSGSQIEKLFIRISEILINPSDHAINEVALAHKNISPETDKNVNIATEKAPVASPSNQDRDHLFKFLIIGDFATGKTSILLRFSDNLFKETYLVSIGVDFKIKTIEVNNISVKLEIWDTAGQERFRTITASFYEGAHCMLITYSSRDRESFENVIAWIKEVEKFAPDEVKVALVENEFENTERQVAEHEGQEFANNHNMEFFRVNAKSGSQIDKPFIKMSEILINSSDYAIPNYSAINKEEIAMEKETVKEEEKTQKHEVKPHSNIDEYVVKILLIGDSGTGKSSLVLRYSDNAFTESFISTIAVDFKTKETNIENQLVKMRLWDIAGQQRFRSIICAYFKGAHCILILYDSSDRESFVNIEKWIKETEMHASNDCLKFLVEHVKSDKPREVESFEGEEFAKRHNLLFSKVNAKTNEGVSELFEIVALKALEKLRAKEDI